MCSYFWELSIVHYYLSFSQKLCFGSVIRNLSTVPVDWEIGILVYITTTNYINIPHILCNQFFFYRVPSPSTPVASPLSFLIPCLCIGTCSSLLVESVRLTRPISSIKIHFPLLPHIYYTELFFVCFIRIQITAETC